MIEKKQVATINKGLLIYLGINAVDNFETCDAMIDKCLNLRIFNQSNGQTQCSVKDIHGSICIVSQFTLYADISKGRRPFYGDAAKKDQAKPLYDYFIKEMKQQSNLCVECGQFGEQMIVSSENDGPVTILIDF